MADSASLVHLLADSVHAFPDSPALVQDSVVLSYRELWSSAGKLSAYLQENGLKAGDRVSLLMENSPLYSISYYAVLMANGVIVALNTSAKQKDLSTWIRHSDSKWLIANSLHPELVSLLDTVRGEIKLIVDDSNIELGEDNVRRLVEIFSADTWSEPDLTPIKQENLASIIYTSGTTGNPKGVMLSHRNLFSNTLSILEYLKLTHSDSILNVLPFYYSYGNSVLHTHLASGGKIILHNSLAYPKLILEQMQNSGVSGFAGVPSTFALLMNRTKFSEYNLSSLRYMTQAGGAMAPANVKRIREELPDIDFFVMYGQTEATARITYLPPEQFNEKPGSIGIPVPNVNVEIRDENDNKVRPGVTGQICVQGDSIMMGYWKDKQETDKVLKNGWLYTGDLAHYDQDEYIYIDGRSSEMIKSGAHRISPKEIEEVIHELAGVSEVAVIGVNDELMGQLIKAFVVRKEGSDIKKQEILRHCRNNLATYKIPKYVEFVADLPKTASGKVRRFMLQEQN